MLRSGPQSRSYHGAGGTPAPSSVAPQIGDSVLGHGDGPPGGYGGKVHDGDRFLDQAKEVQISQADRQEGYDTTLLALKPRQTAVDTAEAPRTGSPIPDSASPLVATPAQQPIASQVAYAARDPSADKERQSKKRRSKRKSKKRPWYQTPLALLVGGGIILLGLGVGLGVGLGLHKEVDISHFEHLFYSRTQRFYCWVHHHSIVSCTGRSAQLGPLSTNLSPASRQLRLATVTV